MFLHGALTMLVRRQTG